MTRPVPFSEQAEKDLLGAIIASREARLSVLDDVHPDDFYVPHHRAIYKACIDLHAEGLPVDATTVSERVASAQATKAALQRLSMEVPLSMNAPGYARIVIDKAFCRRAILTAEQVIDTGYAANVDEVRAIVTNLEQLLVSPLDTVVGEEVLDVLDDPAVDEEKPWVIPGIFRLKERLVLTGAEGWGKSSLIRQLAVGCASGVHPFTSLASNMPRSVVVVVDLQEDRFDLRNAFRAMLERTDAYEPGHLFLKARPQGMNLLAPADVRWLESLVAHHRPDVLVIGPVRKLYRQTGKFGKGTEEATDELTRVLDDLRIEYGFALILEAHSGHDRDDWRPRGSSVWLDWPEFGYGLAPESDAPRVSKLMRWRGDRHSGRAWPRILTSGHRWPWDPGEEDYRRALKASNPEIADEFEQTEMYGQQ